MIRTLPRRSLVVRALAVACLALGVSACQNTWGVRESYRNYIAGPIGGGEIVASNGATHPSGPGAGGGAFTWSLQSSSFNPATESGWLQLQGKVETRGHRNAGGIWVLDTTFTDPRLVINGDQGTLYVDLVYRPFQGTNPNPVPPKQTVNDVSFATVDLSGVDWTPNSSGKRTISNAPMVGIPATMDLIGWDDFYGTPTTLDPISLTF